MDSSDLSPTTPRGDIIKSAPPGTSEHEFKLNVVSGALSALCLKYVEFGTNIVVMNDQIDVTIGGEPHLAFQLWFNMKSGKAIRRVWGQTIACEKIVDVSQLIKTCKTHFHGQPCIGCPLNEDELKLPGFVISQTPIPRKVALKCQKVLKPDENVKSCPQCLRLGNTSMIVKNTLVKKEISEQSNFDSEKTADVCKQEKVQFKEETLLKQENISESDENEPSSQPCEEKFACHTANCGYKTKNKSDFREHCEELSHYSISYQKKNHKTSLLLKKNNYRHTTHETDLKTSVPEGKLGCKSEGCDYKTNSHIQLKDHCTELSHTSRLTKVKIDQINITCETCNKVLDTRLAYKRHMDEEHEGGPFHIKCDICGKVLNVNVFHCHMRSQHGQTGVTLRKCDWCNDNLSTSSLKQHSIRQHFYGVFECEICTFRGDFTKDLIHHVNQDHKEEKSAKCPSCLKEQPLENIECHYQKCVRLRSYERAAKSKNVERICETCGKKLKTKTSYSSHLKMHLREQGESAENANLFHYCEKCGKRFSSKTSLKFHRDSVHENVQYPCQFCPMTFKNNNKKKEHVLIDHSTDVKYQCKYCNKRFGAVTTARNHERLHEEPKFSCSHCGKKMKSQEGLDKHERYHTGEKPFKCSICGTGFVGRGNLAQHMTGVHKIAGPNGRKAGWRKSKARSRE